MNFKNLFCILAVSGAVFASALADAPTAIVGRGQSVSQDGQKAGFMFRVGKNENGQTRGNFTFHTRATDPNRVISIKMTDPAGLQANGNKGTFGGPAVLVVRIGDKTETFRGRVNVRIADNRAGDRPEGDKVADKPTRGQDARGQIDKKADTDLPGYEFDLPKDFSEAERNRRDHISVEFQAQGSDRSFSYAGVVVHGDIAIRNGNRN